MVTVYFDFVCPFCYLGRSFWMRMQEERPVESTWVPWEIHPEYPPEGGPEKSDARARADLNRYRALGGDICRFELGHFSSNTRNALMGLEFARAAGRADAYIERVFRAVFVEDTNVSSVETVVDLGGEVGLDRSALERSLLSGEYGQVLAERDREAEGMGLEVVPSFVRSGKLVLAGTTTMDFAEFRAKYPAVRG